MVLLAVILALAIERIWDTLADLRSFAWFERYTARLRAGLGAGRLWDGPLGVFLVMFIPLIVVAVLQQALAGLLGLLAFVFAVFVLLFSLGPRDLDADVLRFINAWDRGDEEGARGAARRITGLPYEPADAAALGRTVLEGIVVAAHERIIGVIFWFAILGPLGALLFRLSCELANKDQHSGEQSGFVQAARVLHGVLSWLPCRLTVLGFALTGSFGDALHRWREEAPLWERDWLAGNRQVLVAGGLGALQADRELSEEESGGVSTLQVRAALAMVWRTVILLVAIIALVTLADWVS